MRGLLAAGLACLCIAGASAQDENWRQRAFIEVSSPKTSFLVQEIIPLRIRIGVEDSFLAENLIQPFRQRLDLPLRLSASWLQEFEGALVMPAKPVPTDPAEAARMQSLVLNGLLGRARRSDDLERNGRSFRVYEIEGGLLAEEPGELTIATANIQVAYATSFREDFLNGRVPDDRQELILTSEALKLDIENWPEAGRPDEFLGAVGQFSIRAEAQIGDLAIGDPFELTLHFEGSGNLDYIPLPRLDDLDGFHVIGRLESRQEGHRSIRYEMAGLSTQLSEIPSIPFAYLDPNPSPTYRRIQTEPISLSLRALPDGTQLLSSPNQESELVDLSGDVTAVEPIPSPGDEETPPPPPILVEDIRDIRSIDSRGSTPWQQLPGAVLLLGLLLPLLLTGIVLFELHRREQKRLEAERPEPNRAAKDFRHRAHESDVNMGQAFAEFIAGRLECPVAAVIRPQLSARLRQVGIPDELADRSEELLEALVDRRYDGTGSGNGFAAASAPRLVEDLEARFLQLEAAE